MFHCAIRISNLQHCSRHGERAIAAHPESILFEFISNHPSSTNGSAFPATSGTLTNFSSTLVSRFDYFMNT